MTRNGPIVYKVLNCDGAAFDRDPLESHFGISSCEPRQKTEPVEPIERASTVTIPLLAHVLTPAVLQSVAKLDFGLDTWRRNPRIGSLLSKTVLSGGKRLRPIMTFMMADLFGIAHSTIGPFGLLIELVHAASLAHDDVVDNASFRRGEPSINAIASNKQAVLAGDYLLAYVLQEISERGSNDLVVEMSGIIADLAEGEWLQIENSQHEALTWAHIETVALKKTGSVLRWCCAAPALLAHCDAETLRKARRLGEAIGIAFQLTDDILDFKRRDGAEGADIKNRVINSVIFEALCLELGQERLNMLDIERIEPRDTLNEAILRVRRRVDQLVQESMQLLAELSASVAPRQGTANEEAHLALQAMIRFLAQRI